MKTKLKCGMAVKVLTGNSKGRIGRVIWEYIDVLTKSKCCSINFGTYTLEKLVSRVKYLPNHFINNPGKTIMRAWINTAHHSMVVIEMKKGEPARRLNDDGYTTPKGARKTLKDWAKKYGINVEVVS